MVKASSQNNDKTAQVKSLLSNAGVCFEGYSRMSNRKFSLFQIEPSTRCNLNCLMCPWKNMHESGRDMDMELFSRISPYLTETEEIDFTGSGEPLMNQNLHLMIKASKEAGCRVGFSSNGALLNPDRFNQLFSSGLDWVAVSIDAATEETYRKIRLGGSFSQILKNLEYIGNFRKTNKTDRPRLMIVFVMMKENYAELPDLIEIASGAGVDFVVAKHLDVINNSFHDSKRLFLLPDTNRMAKDLSLVIDLAKTRAKKAGIKFRSYEVSSSQNAICEQNPLKTLFVTVDGMVSPCIGLAYMRQRYFAGQRHDTALCRFGDIKTADLDDIFENEDYVSFRRIFENRSSKSLLRCINSFLNHSILSTKASRIPLAPPACRYCYHLYEV